MAKTKKLQRYPYFLGILSVVAFAVVFQIFLILDCFRPFIQYSPDAVSGVMSTCCGVIASLYGITLTGYIFFADRFQNTSKDDESLYDAVQALLIRYNHMAGIISIMCLVCIFSGVCIMLYDANTVIPEKLYRFIVNETLMVFFCTFDFILYFVISVLDPQKVSRISSQKKEKLSVDKKVGNMQEFLGDWAAIENALYVQRDNLVRKIHFIPVAGSRAKPEMLHTMELLRNYGRIGADLWRKLERLRQYHNLALHDPSMTVSQEMCTLAKEVRAELESKM